MPNSTGFTPPTNKVFLGWDADDEATTATYVAGDTYTLVANIILYAIWETAE